MGSGQIYNREKCKNFVIIFLDKEWVQMDSFFTNIHADDNPIGDVFWKIKFLRENIGKIVVFWGF